jgi:hypothetical protein
MIWDIFTKAWAAALGTKPTVDVLAVGRFAELDAVDADDARLAAAGQAAIVEAERYFDMDVVDPPATDKSARADRWRSIITTIITLAGWAFALPYLGNRKGATQWCGMFAAACWRAAGIDPSMLATFWASTARLHAWGHGKPFNGKPNPKPKRGRRLAGKIVPGKPLPFEPRAGDILVVGDGDPAAGDHICLIVSYDAERRVFVTIEGNGGGLGPDGKRREGIVRGERALASAMWMYRPAVGDLLAA